MSAPVNRDHARAALSVLLVAQQRDDMDAVDAMGAAIRTYQALEEREAQDRAAADRRSFWRSVVEHRAHVRLSMRQVDAIRKSLAVLALCLSGIACGVSPMAADQPDETLSRFHASVSFKTPAGQVVTGPGLSEDLPTNGYRNRWRYVVGPDVAQALGSVLGWEPVYAQVRVAATVNGTMVHEAVGMFTLELAPASPEVAEAIRASAPGEETIWQTMTLRPMPEGYAELLTEEPLQ